MNRFLLNTLLLITFLYGGALPDASAGKDSDTKEEGTHTRTLPQAPSVLEWTRVTNTKEILQAPKGVMTLTNEAADLTDYPNASLLPVPSHRVRNAMKTATKLEIVGTLDDAGILAIRDGLVRNLQLRVLRLASPLNDDAAQIISGALPENTVLTHLAFSHAPLTRALSAFASVLDRNFSLLSLRFTHTNFNRAEFASMKTVRRRLMYDTWEDKGMYLPLVVFVMENQQPLDSATLAVLQEISPVPHGIRMAVASTPYTSCGKRFFELYRGGATSFYHDYTRKP